MIKTIIFDIGGVLTFTNFETIYNDFAEKAGVSSEFVVNYHRTHMDKLILGTTSLEQFFADMSIESGKSGLELQKVWFEVSLPRRKVNQELLDLTTDLRNKYSIGTLTNLSPHRKILDDAMGLYSYFDYKVLSCDAGLKKPDPRFYNLALKAAGAEPEEAIFVDDYKGNVDAAESMGIKSILYTDNVSFRRDLDILIAS